MLPAIMVGASLLSGYLNGQASDRAANAQKDAANNANATQKYMYDQSRADMQPWRDYGLSALDRMNGRSSDYSANEAKRKELTDRLTAIKNGQAHWSNLLKGGGFQGMKAEWQTNLDSHNKDFEDVSKQLAGIPQAGATLTGAELGNSIMQDDPGYQFRLDQGTKQMNAQASARGRSMGGAAMKELSRYGQDYASNEYGNAYNRLAAQAGVGQAATNNMANLGQAYGQQYGQNQAAIGNANAAGHIGQANAVNGMINNGMNGYMMYNLFNKPKVG